MGQSGELVFFTEKKPRDPVGTLRRLFELGSPGHIFVASRTTRPDNSWRRFKRAIRRGDLALPTPIKLLPEPHTIDSVCAAYRPRRLLSAQIAGSAVGQRIYEACERGIPEQVRDRFCPGLLMLKIGAHDIFESSERDGPHYFGRAFISISFDGHGSPNDWPEARRLILSLPEVSAARREFEEITGPLKTCVYWYA